MARAATSRASVGGTGRPDRAAAPRSRAAVRSLALLGALGAGVHGGEAAGSQAAQTRDSLGAWIGIIADPSSSGVPRGRSHFSVVVVDVHSTGPAARAGIMPGDLVVAFDGLPLVSYGAWLQSLAGLEPGRPLRLRVVRDGEEMDATIVADARPGSFTASFDLARLDSLQRGLSRRVDSILRLRAGGGAHDSVVMSWQDPSDRLRLVEGRIRIGWQQALAAERAVAARAGEARERMREAEREMRLAEENLIPPDAGGGGDMGAAGARSELPESPSISFVIGRPVVLGGAQVRGMNRDLGRYFGLGAGVLVTDVLAESPAARADFRAGDVIVEVEGEAVESVEQLRAALAAAELPAEIAVSRQGVLVRLTYPARR